MAIGDGAVWEVRTTGSDANGGFYVSGGTDYSQQDAAQLTVTDCVTNGTTTVTSATGGFTSAMIGNGINVAGTIRKITAVGSSTSITVDASITAGSGQTAKVGGALASLGMALGFAVAFNKVWVKAGTYAIANGTVNTSGNKCSIGATGIGVSGYSTTRGDGGRPTLQASATSTVILTTVGGANNWAFDNVILDGNSLTGTYGYSFVGGVAGIRFRNVKAMNCRGAGFAGGYNSNGGMWIDCEALNNTGCPGFDGGSVWTCYGCKASGNSYGFYNVTLAARCLSHGNSSDGFRAASSGGSYFISCTAYGNGGNGIYLPGFNTGVGASPVINCIAYGNTGYGVKMDDIFNVQPTVIRTALGGNGTAISTGWTAPGVVTDTVTLTADPFTNASGGDFSLNSTAGGGAACRAAGIPGTFPGGLTVGYLDIGAAQHQDSGSGSGGGMIRGGGLDGGLQ